MNHLIGLTSRTKATLAITLLFAAILGFADEGVAGTKYIGKF